MYAVPSNNNRDTLAIDANALLIEVFDLFFQPLCYFAEGLISDKGEAEDIAIRAIESYWKTREKFPATANIKAFLYISVRNACLNYLKHLKVKSKAQKNMEQLAESQDGEMEVKIIEAELLQKINLEIQHLPAKYREVLALIYQEGLSHSEVAARLNITTDLVKVRKARATESLRQVLSKKGILSAAASIPALYWLFR